MTTLANRCAWCTRFRPEVSDRTICDAFPEGIPEAIQWMDHEHRRPFPGDHGLRFTAEPGTEDLVPEDHA
jgi:hypothetical protein